MCWAYLHPLPLWNTLHPCAGYNCILQLCGIHHTHVLGITASSSSVGYATPMCWAYLHPPAVQDTPHLYASYICILQLCRIQHAYVLGISASSSYARYTTSVCSYISNNCSLSFIYTNLYFQLFWDIFCVSVLVCVAHTVSKFLMV